MLRLPDKTFNTQQLNEELTLLDLPGFVGVARFSREIDGQGRAVIENGAVKRVPPYILVKSDDLTAAQKTAATKAVADHIPVAEPQRDPRFEGQAKAIEAATTVAEVKAAVAELVRAL